MPATATAAGSKRARQAAPTTAPSKRKQASASTAGTSSGAPTTSRALKRVPSLQDLASGDEREEASLDAQLFKQFAQRVRGKPTAKEQQLLQQQQARLQQQLSQAASDSAEKLKTAAQAQVQQTIEANVNSLTALFDDAQQASAQLLPEGLSEHAMVQAQQALETVEQDTERLTALITTSQAALSDHQAQQGLALLEVEHVLTLFARQAGAQVMKQATAMQAGLGGKRGRELRLGKHRCTVGDLLQMACRATAPIGKDV